MEKLQCLLENRAHEFLASVPKWTPACQKMEKFKKRMAIFLSSDHGAQSLSLVGVKMLSVSINKPVALAIIMPGLPFHEHCGPFLICGQKVLDNLSDGQDPQVLMYEPVTCE